MDVQGVSIFAESSVDVQGVSIFAENNVDVQSVSLFNASSKDVQGSPLPLSCNAGMLDCTASGQSGTEIN